MKYTIPEPKPEKPTSSEKSIPYTPSRPSTWFEATPEMVKALNVGQSITLTIKGKVKSLEMRQCEGEEKQHCEISVELHQIEIPDSEFEDLLEES